MEEREPVVRLNFYDLIELLVKWRKLFIVNFIIVVAIAVVIALLLPVWYSATTQLLPPKGGGGALPSFLPKELAGVAMSFGLEVAAEHIYQTVLASRTLRENMVKRFNLREVYEMDDKAKDEDVIKAFDAHLKVKTADDGTISITVEDRSPERAAEMANACIEELDRIYSGITSESARKNREYIGKRLAEVSDSLKTLQTQMKKFQETTNIISIPEQLAAMIKAAADVKGQQLAAEVQLEVIRNSFGENHPLAQQLTATIRELGAKYIEIIQGADGGFFLSLNELPEYSQQYTEIFQRTRIQTMLFEMIYPQYENARIQEQRETVNVQVLDPARVPERKSRPVRRNIVLIAAAASILFTLVVVIMWEYLNTLPRRNPEDWGKIKKIQSMLRRR